MAEIKENGKKIRLSIASPTGVIFDGDCDALTVTVADSAADGSFGGSAGIHPGHIAAAAALADGGRVRARLDGEVVLDILLRGGFAQIAPDRVSILTDGVAE